MQTTNELSPLNRFFAKALRSFFRACARGARSASFQNIYAFSAALFLLVSTAYWSILGAHVQIHNADQLSDPYLFSNWQTFHGATFPGAHTFLLKWPIFWLLH